jgi:hypothetical protein
LHMTPAATPEKRAAPSSRVLPKPTSSRKETAQGPAPTGTNVAERTSSKGLFDAPLTARGCVSAVKDIKGRMHVQAERIQDLEAEVRHTREAGESADESHKADEDTLKPSGSRMSIYFTVHEGAGGQTSRAAGHLMEREQKQGSAQAGAPLEGPQDQKDPPTPIKGQLFLDGEELIMTDPAVHLLNCSCQRSVSIRHPDGRFVSACIDCGRMEEEQDFIVAL